MQSASIGELPISNGGQSSAFIATGASTTNLKAFAGRVCKVCITTAGTAAFSIFDSLVGSGTAVFVSPASTPQGTVYDLQFPLNVGLTVVNVSSGPAFAISWD
jgi:hypothetical protein